MDGLPLGGVGKRASLPLRYRREDSLAPVQTQPHPTGQHALGPLTLGPGTYPFLRFLRSC